MKSKSMIQPGDIEATCRRCNETKPIEDFCKDKSKESGFIRLCRKCRRDDSQHLRNTNPSIWRGWHLSSKYGMTIGQWDLLFESQGKTCAICITQVFGVKGPVVDHNHKTNKVRGILCHWCNIVVGYIENGWDLEVPAITKYLEDHRALANCEQGRGEALLSS